MLAEIKNEAFIVQNPACMSRLNHLYDPKKRICTELCTGLPPYDDDRNLAGVVKPAQFPLTLWSGDVALRTSAADFSNPVSVNRKIRLKRLIFCIFSVGIGQFQTAACLGNGHRARSPGVHNDTSQQA